MYTHIFLKNICPGKKPRIYSGRKPLYDVADYYKHPEMIVAKPNHSSKQCFPNRSHMPPY